MIKQLLTWADHHLDLGDPVSIERAVGRTVETLERLDVLVANAVRWPLDARAPLAEVDHAAWTRALRANLEGTALTVRVALPYLARSSAGRIVLISSGVSRHGIAGATAYSTAKAGLDGLLASLKWETGANGVLVNIVSPGFTVTRTISSALATTANVRWKLVDRDTGAENAQIDWTFRVGDQVKLRLVNEMDSDHPMPHPFHVHGAGRFVILARDDAIEPNLVWKDTVLVRTGETVDILLDVTNPGRWMAHCHIAEHHESGMMFSFNVVSADAD